eukprot:4505872-Pyramimonas_sp.AAC.2
MACPCGPWSNLTSFQKDQVKVRERQFRDHPLLRFAKEEADAVKDYGGASRIRGGRESGVSPSFEDILNKVTLRSHLRAWRSTAEAYSVPGVA